MTHRCSAIHNASEKCDFAQNRLGGYNMRYYVITVRAVTGQVTSAIRGN